MAMNSWCTRIAQRCMLLAIACLGWMVTTAHVGTNQVVFEGTAGGYPVRVMIDPPGVVPGQVPIVVRVLSGSPTRVTVRAAQWNVGTKGAPPAEDAAIVSGDAGVWSHELWIMTASTYAVYVGVEGPAGNGTVVVPLQTTATRTLGMERGMGALLIVLGLLLVAGILTIAGAASREGTLAPGETPTPARVRAARVTMATAAGILALALVGGSQWWNAEERAYQRRLYRPLAIDTRIRAVDNERVLTIGITDSLWLTNRLLPLMPDHGKLMHLFLIRADDHDAIAHLHPVRVHPDSFVTRVPPLPQGRYLLFGDLLFQNGAQRTLVDTVDMPVQPVVADANASANTKANPETSPTPDVDDAWRVVRAVPLGDSVVLASGGSLRLAADAPVARARDLRLQVTLHDADGQASTTEPYMGMGGHAMVLRRDGGIFMHLHPMGTASMTAQAQLMRRERGDTARLDSAQIAAVAAAAESSMHDVSMPASAAQTHATMNGMTGSGPIAFPFAFPSAGDYRVFVQIRRRGAVETAAFDVHVP
jgi:hypothetical protein